MCGIAGVLASYESDDSRVEIDAALEKATRRSPTEGRMASLSRTLAHFTLAIAA